MAVVDPTEIDLLLRELVEASLAEQAAGSADLSFAWSDSARMWFTELTPSRRSAARLSIAFDGDDLLSCVVGATWFEIFPFAASDDEVARVRELVDAVIAGRVEESGMRGKEFARIELASGPLSVGAAHLPWPWKGRASRRYQPYV